MQAMGQTAEIRKRALDLLARREHSEHELQRKLVARGYPPGTVGEALTGLKAAGMQNDTRYTEAYIRNRAAKGYGPLRISRELYERGIADGLAAQVMAAMETDWEELARSVRQKKFGLQAPAGIREQARQSRFLQQRGFTSQQIRNAVKDSTL